MRKTLTIGMCTHDDINGVYFSLQSLRLYHPIVETDAVELLVVDNNPESVHGQALQKWIKGWCKKKVKYIPYTEKTSTSARNVIFEQAEGKYCISMDCHVMFPPGSLEYLLAYYKDKPNCKDIVQGPLMYDNITGYSTHFTPGWGGDMYGKWGKDEESYKKGVPFDIPMQGLGVFSCETKNWLGFNPHFRGFGGEEGYIHEKFRQNGGRSVCIPQFKWLHRFLRPDGVNYPLILEDRIWNYFVGWLELKQDPSDPMIKDIHNYFSERTNKKKVDEILRQAIQTIT